MTKKHLLTISFIVLLSIILVSCSNTQAVVSEKSTTTLPSAESTSVTESTTVNTTVQKTDSTSVESSISQATKTTNTETARASNNKPTSPNTKADKTVQNTTKTVTATSKITTTSKPPTTKKTSQCSNNNNHSMKCGNMGRWFDSKLDVKAYVDSVMKSWADKWESGEISDDEYFANCPQGYECWSCGYCGKWTGNFK
jgi:cytoskeletal protein RodZ